MLLCWLIAYQISERRKKERFVLSNFPSFLFTDWMHINYIAILSTLCTFLCMYFNIEWSSLQEIGKYSKIKLCFNIILCEIKGECTPLLAKMHDKHGARQAQVIWLVSMATKMSVILLADAVRLLLKQWFWHSEIYFKKNVQGESQRSIKQGES